MDNIMDKILTLPLKQMQHITTYMPDSTTISRLADFFNIFSDGTRIKILTALSISTMCVNDLSVVLNLNQTTISHQLKILRSTGIVNTYRQGKLIYYELSSSTINEVLSGGVDYLMAN